MYASRESPFTRSNEMDAMPTGYEYPDDLDTVLRKLATHNRFTFDDVVSPDTTECCIVNNTIDTTREHPLRGHQPTKKQFPYFLGKEEAGYVLATQRPPAGTRPICGSNGRRPRGPPPPRRRPPIRLVRWMHDAQKGEQILHSCDNPACIAMAHTRVGSQHENGTEAWQRGRRRRTYLTPLPLSPAPSPLSRQPCPRRTPSPMLPPQSFDRASREARFPVAGLHSPSKDARKRLRTSSARNVDVEELPPSPPHVLTHTQTHTYSRIV